MAACAVTAAVANVSDFAVISEILAGIFCGTAVGNVSDGAVVSDTDAGFRSVAAVVNIADASAVVSEIGAGRVADAGSS